MAGGCCPNGKLLGQFARRRVQETAEERTAGIQGYIVERRRPAWHQDLMGLVEKSVANAQRQCGVGAPGQRTMNQDPEQNTVIGEMGGFANEAVQHRDSRHRSPGKQEMQKWHDYPGCARGRESRGRKHEYGRQP